jgi:hypothetical protein
MPPTKFSWPKISFAKIFTFSKAVLGALLVSSFSIMIYQFHYITASQYERIIPYGRIASGRY